MRPDPNNGDRQICIGEACLSSKMWSITFGVFSLTHLPLLSELNDSFHDLEGSDSQFLIVKSAIKDRETRQRALACAYESQRKNFDFIVSEEDIHLFSLKAFTFSSVHSWLQTAVSLFQT